MLNDDAHRIQTMQTDAEAQKESVKPILAYVLDNTGTVTSEDIQNTVFYIESVFYETFGERLTQLEWSIQKTRPASPKIVTVLSEWDNNGMIQTDVDGDNTSFGNTSTVYYKDMTVNTHENIEAFINELQYYNENTEPYTVFSETNDGDNTVYDAFTSFIDTAIEDLQDSNTGNRDTDVEHGNNDFSVFNGEYYEWLQRHPLYPHDSRFDGIADFEDWNHNT